MQWKVIYSVISINKVIANESLKSRKKKGQSVSDSVFLDKEKGGEKSRFFPLLVVCRFTTQSDTESVWLDWVIEKTCHWLGIDIYFLRQSFYFRHFNVFSYPQCNISSYIIFSYSSTVYCGRLKVQHWSFRHSNEFKLNGLLPKLKFFICF